ncbi:jg24646 [Pararge aegeria aegeria]|uniref:Jg24646 protein n=1 Tax=Pararge aegeria aegeria TaxID=348720 RepID=A0A8S4QQ91_9NEOP|nr:jg24646 [Pararge aegeria aegeria]
MRITITLIILIAASSFCDLDFNSKTRNFGVELLYHTVQGTDGNLAISPYAIWYLLTSMAYQTMGVTREEISEVLLLTEDRNEVLEGFISLRRLLVVNEGVNITLLNFLFYDEGFLVKSDSLRMLEKDFRFITRRLNFAEPQMATNSALRALQKYGVPSPRNFIRTEDFVNSTMIMCNYLSFQASWLKPFNVSETSKIYYGNEDNVGTSMMYKSERFRFSNFDSLKASVTELPYEGDGKYCMLLIRPYSGYDVDEVYRNIRTVSIKDILAKLQSDVEEIGLKQILVMLQKCKIDLNLSLNEPLFHMGLTSMFDRDLANFENFGKDDIYISEIAHRVTIDISETQTIVYATTPSYLDNKPITSNETTLKPFIFVIIEKFTATVLFGGSYSKIPYAAHIDGVTSL